MRDRRLFIRIELTQAAREHADKSGLDVNGATEVLDAGVQIGDRVSFGGDPAKDFVVIRRRHLIGTGASTLVLLFDLPTES
jgi:hypothetical protein